MPEIDPDVGTAIIAAFAAVLVGIFVAWWESRGRRQLAERQAVLDRVAADGRAKVEREARVQQAGLDRVAADGRAKVERKALVQQAELDRVAADGRAKVERKALVQQAELDRVAADDRAKVEADARVQQARLDRHDDAVAAFITVLQGIPGQLGAIATGEPSATKLAWETRMDAARAMCLAPSQELSDLMLEILDRIHRFQESAALLREKAFRLTDAAAQERQTADKMEADGQPGSGIPRIRAAWLEGSADRELSDAEIELLQSAKELQADFWKYFVDIALPGLRAT